MFSPAYYNAQHPVAQRLHRALERDRLGQTLLLVEGDSARMDSRWSFPGCNPVASLLPNRGGNGNQKNENTKERDEAWLSNSALAASLGLTQALLCKSPRSDCLALGCGTCNSCRRIAKQCHPNVHKVESPQASTASEAAVGIDQIRGMHHQHHLSAYEPGAAVWIVPRAELLTEQAAAGLLKLLEEPKQQRFVLLIVPHGGALPATVVSRCQKLFFPAMPPDEPTRMEQQPDEGTSVDCVGDLVGLIERTPRLQRLELAGRFPEGRDAVIVILRALQRHIMHILRHQIAHQGDMSEVWQGCARLEALQNAMDLIRRNGNRKLVVEELLLRAWP